jgi:RNA polymerase sigma-70 factor (ECF subfamily)
MVVELVTSEGSDEDPADGHVQLWADTRRVSGRYPPWFYPTKCRDTASMPEFASAPGPTSAAFASWHRDRKNRFDRPFVLTCTMIATLGFSTRPEMEAALDARAQEPARDQFVRMAEGELDRAYRLAGLILGSGGEAEDAVGDALERAWREIDRLRDMDRFQAWFDRILVNACRDRLRRRGRIRFIRLPGDDSPAAPDPFAAVLQADAAARAMRDLPDDEREVVVLHFWADLTLEAVADRLGRPVGTVKSRLHRALARMRVEDDR